MAIEYYAHTRENPETGLIEYQTVEQHLRGTAELCAEFADKLNAKEYGELVGSLHDYGKCTREFLNRILNSGPRVDHSTAGAIICAKKDHVFLAACIAGHHSGLPDFGNMYADTADSHTLFGRIKKGISKKFVEKCGDSGVPMPDVKPYMEKNLLFASQWTRMMFSCETDVDFLDTERFVVCSPNNGQTKRLVQILCGKYPFKLNRSMVARRLVNPAPVVKQHVFRNRVRRLFARPEILPVEPFHLQRLEERLGTGIIIRRARAAHTLYSADFLNFVPEIPRCILTAAIGVDYQFSLRPSVHYRVPKRSYRKPTVQHTAYCPANYSPAEQVYECAQIQPSFVSRHICEIRYSFLIRLVCLEILPQQILKWLCFRVGYGCTYTLAPRYWHKSCHGHQSPHALPAYIFADFAQFHLDFPTSVDALAPEKDVFNLHGQVTISYFTQAVFSSLKLVVSLSACL